MENARERDIFRSSLKIERGKPGPKRAEPGDDDDIFQQEQIEGKIDDTEIRLTNEAWEKYPEEFGKITRLARAAGFQNLKISEAESGAQFEKPDTIFFLKNHLHNFVEALNLFEKKDLNPEDLFDGRRYLFEGMAFNFLNMKKFFKKPKFKIFRKLFNAQEKFKKLEGKRGLKEENLMVDVVSKEFERKIICENSANLIADTRSKLSDSEIKKAANQFTYINIANDGVKNDVGVKITTLSNSMRRKKISPAEYKKERDDAIFFKLIALHELFPRLDKKTFTKIVDEWILNAEKIGKKYLEREEEKEKKEDKYGIKMHE